MPVLSLPEFLGLQEAPQAPVFQRTNQLRRPTDWERFAQMADAVTALRQQRPMAQIQAIQNEYDTIRDNADKLRRERETTMQAEQAVSALAGLTPESDDYLTQRRRIMTQFPSAVLDPRVQSVIDDSDRMFNSRQTAMARMEEERLQAENRRTQEEADRRAELASLGVFDPNERARLAKSSELTGEEKFRRSQKPEGVTKDKALDTIINQAFAEFDAQYMPPEGMSDPTEIAIDKSAKKYALNQRLLERFGAAKPQETAPPPTTAPQIQIRPGVAPAEVAPQPVVETVATPQPRTQPAVPAIEQLSKAIKSSQANEDDYLRYIKHPDVSMSQKREAFKALEKIAESPPLRPDLDLDEAIARKETIQDAIANAKAVIDRQDFIGKYVNPAWTEAKSQIASKVEDYAKKIGVSPDNIYNSILKNKYVYNPKLGRISLAEEILGKDIASQPNELVTDAVNKLEAVEAKDSPYRTFFKQMLGEFGERTNAGVLRALAEEKRKPLSAKQADVSVATPLQVTSIKPL